MTMTTSDDDALELLQSLLRICRDSAEGYATAAHDIVDPELNRLCHEYQKQREKLSAELEQRIRNLRGSPDASPTEAGALHRWWMKLRAGSAADPTEAVLTEIERAEDIVVDAYREAEKLPDIDALTRRLIERHYEVVQAAHDRMRQLRDRANYARSHPEA